MGLPEKGSFGTEDPIPTWLITSTPQPTATSTVPEATSAYARLVACWEEPHWESTVVAATSRGSPAVSQELRVTFAYLGGGLHEVSYQVDEDWLGRARGSIDETLQGMEEGSWDPRPGPWCGSCDFLRFCPEGRAEVSR